MQNNRGDFVLLRVNSIENFCDNEGEGMHPLPSRSQDGNVRNARSRYRHNAYSSSPTEEVSMPPRGSFHYKSGQLRMRTARGGDQEIPRSTTEKNFCKVAVLPPPTAYDFYFLEGRYKYGRRGPERRAVGESVGKLRVLTEVCLRERHRKKEKDVLQKKGRTPISNTSWREEAGNQLGYPGKTHSCYYKMHPAFFSSFM